MIAEARQRDAWLHTSQQLCLLANCHRNSKERSQPYEAWEFDPFELAERGERKEQYITWETFERMLGLPDEQEADPC